MRERVLLAILTALTLQLLASGCDDDVALDAPPPPYYFGQDPGSIAENCCGVEYGSVISGTAPPGGRYYWAALVDHDTLVTYGQPVFVPEGPFAGVEVCVPVTYLDGIPSGKHKLMVFASTSLEDVGYIERRELGDQGEIYEVASYADSICLPCCTNESNGGRRRYGAWAGRDLSPSALLTVHAKIEVSLGRLCGQGTPTEDNVGAQQNCFVAMLEFGDPALGRPRQAQLGWMHRRLAGNVVDTFLYWELTLNDTIHVLYAPPVWPAPQDGSLYQFDIARIDDTLVRFYAEGILGNAIAVEPQYGWLGVPFGYAMWSGEIHGRETDLPGTDQDHCEFFNCQFSLAVDSVLRQAQFDDANYSFSIGVTKQTGNRPDEWGIGYVTFGDRFWIWDHHPY